MESNIEERIVSYESNLLKQAFFSKDTMLFLKDKIPEGFFQNTFREILWKSYIFIIDNDEDISRSSIEDVFISSDNGAHVPLVTELVSASYTDEDQWSYHYKYLYDLYAKRNLAKIAKDITTKIKTLSAMKIIDETIEDLNKLDNRDSTSLGVKDATLKALSSILNRRSGKINPFIITGHKKFDHIAKLDFNEIAMIAAAKKIGKTKFILHIISEMLAIDPSIAVKLYSFELTEEEIIYELVSRDVELTPNQIQSKGYDLSDNEVLKIESSMNRINSMDMIITSKPTTINEVKKEFIKFCRKRDTNRCILIIDNLGLLKDKGRSQTEVDDHIGSTMVDIKERTRGLIIPVHHMTKEMEKEIRLKSAYRPRLDHLKGSTRVPDYANKVFLLHRPGNYEDLVAKEQAKGVIKLKRGKYKRGELILKMFLVELAINRNGDKGIARFLHKLQYCKFKEW